MNEDHSMSDPGSNSQAAKCRDLKDLPEDLLVRPAVNLDVPDICRLEQICFSDPWSEASLVHDLTENPAAHYWVAVLPDNRLIGYIAWWQVDDEAEIINLAVSPEWRGRQLGHHLLSRMIDETTRAGASCVRLEVRESNQPARRLYDQAGFRQIGIRTGYYADDHENAITMLKRLR